jgi:hypothetical protein
LEYRSYGYSRWWRFDKIVLILQTKFYLEFINIDNVISSIKIALNYDNDNQELKWVNFWFYFKIHLRISKVKLNYMSQRKTSIQWILKEL